MDLFGFQVDTADGKRQFYRYRKLPFGVSTAVFLVDRLVRPLKRFCHSLNIDLSVYIDDGITIEAGQFRCFAAVRFVVFILRMSGWKLNMVKSSLLPTQEISYLGFLINSNTMKVSLPEEKIVKVYHLLSVLRQAFYENTSVKARDLAAFLGILAHSQFSHGDVIKIISRNSNNELGKLVSTQSWAASLKVTADMKQELDFCFQYFRPLNGRSLIQEQAYYEIMGPRQIQYLVENITPEDMLKPCHIFVSGNFITQIIIVES